MRSVWRRELCSHQSSMCVERIAGDGFDAGIEKACAAEVQHDLGRSAGEEDLNGGVVFGAVGERVDEARNLTI